MSVILSISSTYDVLTILVIIFPLTHFDGLKNSIIQLGGSYRLNIDSLLNSISQEYILFSFFSEFKIDIALLIEPDESYFVLSIKIEVIEPEYFPDGIQLLTKIVHTFRHV